MLTLVVGGARSGKSRHAQSLCGGGPVTCIVTARPDDGDPEMQARIDRHRRDRPSTWTTVEASHEVPAAVRQASRASVVLVDCVTVWLSNLMWYHRELADAPLEEVMLACTADLAAAARERSVVAVANEVGGGIVPEQAVARRFRDVHGLATQLLAREAARVVLVVAGLPIVLK